MGFEDKLAQAQRGGSDDPPKPDYKVTLDQFVEDVFKAIELSPDNWTRVNLEDSDIKAGQERVEGTTHMLLEGKGSRASYQVHFGDGHQIPVEFHGHLQSDGKLLVDAAGIKIKLEPVHASSLDNFKKELLKLAKKL